MNTLITLDTIHVVLVDDDADHLGLLAAALTDGKSSDSSSFVVHSFADPSLALASLPAADQLVIVSDYNMPGGSGLDWLGHYLQANAGPVIMLTGHGDEHIAVEAFRAGASDYLNKFQVLEDPAKLPRAIREAVRRHRLEKTNRRLSRELKAANTILETKHANLQQLTRAMTHDLQTPLVGLTGSIDALRRHLGENVDKETAHWLGRLEGASLRAITMLDDLMTYAKAGAENLRLSPIDIDATMRDVMEDLAGAALVRNVEIQWKPCGVLALAEEQGLRRLLSNLIGNAIKYSESESGGCVAIGAVEEERKVRITITDNGPGVPPEQLEKVLLPFKRLRSDKPGTGLGLAISKRYAETFGGRLWLESDGKTGTSAVCELSAASAAQDIPVVLAGVIDERKLCA